MREYDRGLLAAIQQRWFTLLDLSKALDLLCQKAVLDPAPFSPWPYAVRKALTNECRSITLTFYFR